MPYLLWDFFHLGLTHIKLLTGVLPPPFRGSLSDLESYIFQEVRKICEQHDSKLVLLDLGELDHSPVIQGITTDYIINADSALWAMLLVKDQNTFDRQYSLWHFNGQDSILYDNHPNAHANKVIAQEVIRKIRQINSLSGDKILN